MQPIRRALISVSDKTGILMLAATLERLGIEIISTGGTGEFLKEGGFSPVEISTITGKPEAFGGKVKTLSFEIAAALLFDRREESEEADKLGIRPIDLVICNLYPFAQVARSGAPLPELVKNIDIGGVTMIRAAAKNADAVGVIVDPADYEAVSRELIREDSRLSRETRKRLMRKAFHYTADYDALISGTLDEVGGESSLRLAFADGRKLRYGENPHQEAWMYRLRSSPEPFKVLQGKELSATNLIDIHAAVSALSGLGTPAWAVVKHGNPCGLAQGANPLSAFQLAWSGDPVSAFGSVLAFNGKLDLLTAQGLEMDHPDKSRRRFVEVITAHGFSREAREFLVRFPNLRLVDWDGYGSFAGWSHHMLGTILVRQETDLPETEPLQSVTSLPFPEDKQFLAQFAIQAVTRVASNGIVIVRGRNSSEKQLLGMGAGQPNRVASVGLAISRARENLEREALELGKSPEEYVRQELADCVLASDAFFPFPDSIECCATAGIRWIVQPGGSKRDPEVIARANEHGLAMAFTGRRHFRH
jgi:phosphoribosylaminoimidazolecarboxamide formyltransferase/IMP cyclohydrolase